MPLTRCAPGLMHPSVPAPAVGVANSDNSMQRQLQDGSRALPLPAPPAAPAAPPAPATAAAALSLARKACGPRACAVHRPRVPVPS